MSRPIIALQITEEALPLITLLNGGLEPLIVAEDDYYICEIEDLETTTKHDIMSAGTFRALQQVAEANGTDILVFEVKK